MEKNTVSHDTELLAIKYGVVLIKLDPEMDTIGHDDYVAVTFRGGKIVRKGHIEWVTSELKRMNCKIVGIWDLESDKVNT